MENTHTWRWQGNFKNEEKEGRRGGCREGVGEGKQEEEGEEQEEQEQREWGSFKMESREKNLHIAPEHFAPFTSLANEEDLGSNPDSTIFKSWFLKQVNRPWLSFLISNMG